MGKKLPVFMGEVPRYEVRADHMHIIYDELEIVLPVSIMEVGIASAQEALAKWKLGRLDNGEVVRLHRRRK